MRTKQISTCILIVFLLITFIGIAQWSRRSHILDLTEGFQFEESKVHSTERENAAIVILVRNREAQDLASSLREFEAMFNSKYNYPYVMLNDEPFTQEFKDTIEPVISGKVEYGLVPTSQWSVPSWINATHALEKIAEMGQTNVPYGGSLSYRHMCRYNSGFFFRHPLVMQYDYYWRVEPGVRFLCEIDYDPFVYMRENKKKYSFVISFDEVAPTVPTLYPTIKEYIKERNLKPTWMGFFENEQGDFNMCHFWSNFEIGDLRFFRSPQYIDFFDYLDKKGGFFYERWGDAPVHSLAVGLFLKKSEVHYFNDIGYHHHPYGKCPVGEPYTNKCHECAELSTIHQQKNCVANWLRYKPEVDESAVPDFHMDEL
jgi:alpha 1,2-mannosyltransferase